MAFEIVVVNHTPMTSETDPHVVAVRLLSNIGYLPRGASNAAEMEQVRRSIPYRLFMDCLMANPESYWTAEDLGAALHTTKPTVYRHLNRLKGLDLLEEGQKIDADGKERKAYRIRYGDLGRAWTFVEANVHMAMENLRRTCEHLQRLSAGGSRS